MDDQFIKTILMEALPDECSLRPDIVDAASRAVAQGKDLQLPGTEHGDAADMPALIDLIYNSALFIAAVVEVMKGVQSIVHAELDRRARERDARTESLSEGCRRRLVDRILRADTD